MTAIFESRDFTLQSARKRLSFFGSIHTMDPAHPSLGRLETLIQEGKTDILLVEGWCSLMPGAPWEKYSKIISEVRSSSREELIRQYGEAGAAIAAIAPTTSIYSPEPDYGLELQHVESLGFSRDSMFLYYHLRMVYQYLTSDRGTTLEQYLEPDFTQFKELTGWRDYTYTFPRFEELVTSWFGGSLQELMKQEMVVELISTFAPNTEEPERKETNDVSFASCSYRDSAIKNWILHFLNMHDSVLVVYGRHHADTLKKALLDDFIPAFGALTFEEEKMLVHEEILTKRD